ncbi:MAG: hypothetical protein ACOYMT_03825 [Chthoniobacterales bacterium]
MKIKTLTPLAFLIVFARLAFAAETKDDFSTDPFDKFSPRWSCEVPKDNYDAFWTSGVFSPLQLGQAAADLPEAPADAVYFFGEGTYMLLRAERVPATRRYSISTDFQILGDTVSDIGIGMIFNHRGAEKSNVSIHIGGDGKTAWIGSLNPSAPQYTGYPIELGVWYRLTVEVAREGGESVVSAEVTSVDDGTPMRMGFEGRVSDPADAGDAGVGLQIQLGNGHGWTRAVVVDNFVSTAQ